MIQQVRYVAPAGQAKLRITVLCGGPSAEREVSLQSGQCVADALRRRGHEVFVTDIGPDQLGGLDAPADVVFPALHGTFGEDGTIQRIMEQRGLRFVGSGAQASTLAMDKIATKQLARTLGIPTPEFERVRAPADATLALPLVVKPIDQGSSVATSIVRDPAQLGPALERVLSAFGVALVERYIAGDELTVGIVGVRTLAPLCIRPRSAFYDYHAKYVANDTEYLFDAGIPSDVLARVSEMSGRLFAALGCRHLGRVDWMIDADAQPWLLELNTLPGFTSHSLFPMAAANAGMTFDELTEQLVRMALEDRP